MTMRTRLARVYHLATNMCNGALSSPGVSEPADGVLRNDTQGGKRTHQTDQNDTHRKCLERGGFVLRDEVIAGGHEGGAAHQQVHRESDALIFEVGADIPDRCGHRRDMNGCNAVKHQRRDSGDHLFNSLPGCWWRSSAAQWSWSWLSKSSSRAPKVPTVWAR